MDAVGISYAFGVFGAKLTEPLSKQIDHSVLPITEQEAQDIKQTDQELQDTSKHRQIRRLDENEVAQKDISEFRKDHRNIRQEGSVSQSTEDFVEFRMDHKKIRQEDSISPLSKDRSAVEGVGSNQGLQNIQNFKTKDLMLGIAQTQFNVFDPAIAKYANKQPVSGAIDIKA